MAKNKNPNINSKTNLQWIIIKVVLLTLGLTLTLATIYVLKGWDYQKQSLSGQSLSEQSLSGQIHLDFCQNTKKIESAQNQNLTKKHFCKVAVLLERHPPSDFIKTHSPEIALTAITDGGQTIFLRKWAINNSAPTSKEATVETASEKTTQTPLNSAATRKKNLYSWKKLFFYSPHLDQLLTPQPISKVRRL